MVSYGSNAAAQTIAYGRTDSNRDTAFSAYRDVATSIINAKLNRTTDFSTVPDTVTRCANLLAAGLALTQPNQTEKHPFWIQGMELLESLIGDTDTEGTNWGYNILVKRK